jgi:TonB-linked SusC/RagA family outer membrane protein
MKKISLWGIFALFYAHKKLLKIMKLTLLLSIIGTLGLSATTLYSQETKLSLSLNNATVTELLKEIGDKSEFSFWYNSNILNDKKKISLNVKDLTIDKILNLALNDQNLSYEIKDKIIVIYNKHSMNEVTQSQQQKVTGTIVDSSSGEPMPGVNITVEGTTLGVISDINGKYSIELPQNDAVLVFSFMGYLTEKVPTSGQNEINVKLVLDVQKLEEVVVVGYGTQKKVTVTGSVVSTSGADIKSTPATSVANTLVGRLPGLVASNRSGEPGYDDSQLLIRGKNTTGDNSPLIVVDGVADRAGGFSRIDVNDIESVTVLKDASAAIYGSRAANGVILVTTKRGKGGAPKIDYTFNYGLKQPTVLPKMLNSADYATALNEIETLIYGRTPMYTAEQIQKFRDGSDPTNYPNVNWMDEALRKYSPQTRHNLSVSGGSEAVKYFTSVGYQFDDNYYKNSASNYKQYNLRSNVDIQVSKNLKMYANVSIRQEDRNSPHYGSESIWRYLVKGDPRVNIAWPENGKPVLAPQDDFNPLTSANGDMGYQKNKNAYINADLGINFDMPFITKGLGVDAGLYYDKDNKFYKHFQKAFYLYGRDNQTGEYFARQYGPNNAMLEENMNYTQGITANMKLRYIRSFGNHNINTFVAYEQYESKYDYLYSKRQDFLSTEVDQIFAGDSKSQINDGNANETGRQNYFGRVDYSFSEKYLVQFNWRYDGSENFPDGNRFGFFPGVSLGWRASEENFWKENLSFINYFKVRGSWGKMGNDRVDRFNYLTTYTFDWPATFGGSNPQKYSGVKQLRSANPDITWEVSTTTNLGIETKFLDNALSFDFDIFKTKRDKILATRSAAIPQYTGLSLPKENIGKCESNGFEASLNYSKKFNKFGFSIGGNFSYAKSKITYIDEPASVQDWRKRTGKSIGADWELYDAIGIYRTQEDLDKYPHLGNVALGDLIFRDVNDDKVIDGNDKIRPDKTNVPQIVYGINAGVTYKQWELSMLWQGAAKVWQYVFWESGSIGNFTQDYFDNRWTPQNINSKYPRVYDRQATELGQNNTFWLKDASYLRLKNIELSYTLPKTAVDKLPIKGLRVFVSAYNLLTFTGLKDIDPETVAGSQGFAAWSTPQSRVYNFGFNLTF